MPGAHAFLSPSGTTRWLACPPSAKFEAQFPDTESTAAKEGTLAHHLSEILIKRMLGRIALKEYNKKVADVIAHELYEAEMMDYCEKYAEFVIEKYNEALATTKDAMLFQETKLDLTKFIADGFGTLDVAIIAQHKLTIIDLKYGKGVPVSAWDNAQLKVYALGADDHWGFLYGVEEIEMIIYQPRIDAITNHTISLGTLHDWAKVVLIPGAALATDGKGEYTPGDHCRFCRGKVMCSANQKYQMGLLNAMVGEVEKEMPDPNMLPVEKISDILTRGDNFKNWIKAVEDYALLEAMNGRRTWPGFKVVRGTSRRKYSDEQKIINILLQHGYKQVDITETSLLGLTKMQKEIGKTDFDKYVSEHLIKPPGAPTLVPLSDKREVLNAAAMDFQGIDIEAEQ